MSGWFKLERGWMRHECFRDNDDRIAFLWMIEQAVFEDTVVAVKGNPVRIKRGQFSHAISYIAEALGHKKPKIQRILKHFKKWGLIDTQSDTGQNVVTICNYSKYQGDRYESDTQNDNTSIRERYESDTNNKNLRIKELKNNKKNKQKKVEAKKPDDVQQEIWDDWLQLRQAKKAPVTDTVINSIRKQAAKLQWSLNEALEEMCARNWQGFKAEWVNNSRNKTQGDKRNGKSSYTADDALNSVLGDIAGANAAQAGANSPPSAPVLQQSQQVWNERAGLGDAHAVDDAGFIDIPAGDYSASVCGVPQNDRPSAYGEKRHRRDRESEGATPQGIFCEI